MRLIFDEDLSRDLPTYFSGHSHEAVHVEELGWKGIRNSERLRRVSGQYECSLPATRT